LRIRQTDGSYRVFSPFYTPTLDEYQHFECRVGLGYTRLSTEIEAVRTEVTIFIPLNGQVELRDIRVTNLADQPRQIDLIPVVEYTHFDALKQFTNADWVPQTMQSELIAESAGTKILVQYAFMHRDRRHNYFTSNLPVSSFDTDRKVFLGANEYHTWRAPLSLQQPELNDSLAQRGDNIAALLHHLGTLQPGESRQLITQLGQTDQIAELPAQVAVFRDPQAVAAAFTELRTFWSQLLARQHVETPDERLNQMLNIHNPRQCYITKQWSRYLSLYQLGFGARGIGFRDSSQDVMGVMALAPQEGLELIRKLMAVQRRDGSAYHQFNPLTMIASRGDAHEMEDRPQYYSDDHLWIVLAVAAYLRETGNMAVLQESIPFYEKDKRGQPVESGTVLEHLRRALAFTQKDTGAHGLPLAGFADWNDTVNLRTGAESVFTANLYGRALLEMIGLYQHLGDIDSAEKLVNWYDEMRQRVNQHAWDGSWYRRYFDADGSPIGSAQNEHGQIFTNAQSWAVISGFAPPERARQALQAVHERLNTSFGIKLSTPGFDGFDPHKGGVSTYPPGAKENGGIFLHANPWVIIAETLLGNGDRAYEYYRQINPANRNAQSEIYESEPYVYPQNILGDEHPLFGLARNSWLTGTASWVYQSATQYILGVRPTYGGLRIDPCIPAIWSGYRVKRFFRGAWYQIEVLNPGHVNSGVVSIQVDGKPVDGNILPVFERGEHTVTVTLGDLAQQQESQGS
ncbi:MAG: hypothetical protein JW862_17080, partial [Anaerolineales bacterium]|nr:hypothetical protein [Anaerolineales bacterium]